MRFSPTAILVIVVFAILLFGAKRLPDLARSLGQSLRILKSETKAMRQDGPDAPVPPSVEAPRTIKAAPGDPGSRPVTEQQPSQQG
ncbi:Sec-independent protein translocase subunit TatA [Kitasatospora atroaurantiaca]|uniref:Sec-independent protein translocase protein TatA n=1 Tax=Kitasatospora atroaurantiaca TaxID=285545 RepID=A0A561EZ00_9ACTN|nr:Sec-independent protein translocase subunit TatA [Kitasatospora atroaurantiaca]TWE20836.1 sec-independent protein translocase protein TatA [Kitasatospora atroaurantiaca]